MEQLLYELLCRVFGRDYVDAVIAAEKAKQAEIDAAIEHKTEE